MDILWKIARWILFRMDAETAHRIGVFLIRLGIKMDCVPLRIVSGSAFQVSDSPQGLGDRLPTVFGLPFLSRVGLAAGFDKNAEILEGLPALGFGFAEIGTVTPKPQPGNSQPRLFRDSNQKSLLNSMGFNNLGSEVIAERLAKAKKKLPMQFRIGVNIGKNKDTSLEKASQDYMNATHAFEGLADYLVINVSSPNTPGLRSLQTLEGLKPIIEGVNLKISAWKNRPPLLLKLAPEVSGESLATLLQGTERLGVDGFVLTNTLGSPSGGWSGGILTEKSRSILKEARLTTSKPIISVGGILSPEEAMIRLNEGAELIQIYTGWIFEGPKFPVNIRKSVLKSNQKIAKIGL